MAGFSNANMAVALQRSMQNQRGVAAGEGSAGGQNANLQRGLAKSLQVESTRKVAAGELSADPPLPTYLYYGHGSDMLVPNPDFPGQWMGDYNHDPVPADCILISFSAPGISTYRSASLSFKSNIRTPGFVNKLSNPIHFFDDLARANKASNEHLRRVLPPQEFRELRLSPKEPGKIYAETSFSPFAVWKVHDSPDHELYTSGIYDVRNNTTRIFDPASDTPLIMVNGVSTLDEILTKFDGSVFPTAQDITEAVHTYGKNPARLSVEDMELIIELIKLKYKTGEHFLQRDLFRLFPGIHYASACRAMDEDKNVSASLNTARRFSNNGAQLHKSAELLWEENEKPKLIGFFRDMRIIGELNTMMDKLYTVKITEDYIQGLRPLFLEISTFLGENNFIVPDVLRLKYEDIPEFVQLSRINSPWYLKEALDELYKMGLTFRGGKRKRTVKRKRSTKYKSKKRR